MAVLGSLFLKRTLKQFFECDDLASPRGVALIDKLRQASAEFLPQLLEVIPEADDQHREALTEICLEHVGGTNEELILKELDNDATEIRSATVSVLSKSSRINPARLLKKLHEPNAQADEIISILEFQAANLKPEQIVSNALRLERGSAEQLLNLAYKSEQPIDLDVLHVDPDTIKSPSMKIMLLRYLGQVENPRVAELIARFLADSNKTVVIEALKSLRGLKIDFDASLILPAFADMADVSRQLALEVIEERASAEMAPRLAPLTCSKSDELREKFVKLLVNNVTTDSLRQYLEALEVQEWYGKEQALKTLHLLGNDQLFNAAQSLTEDRNEFVRDQSQRLAAQASDPADVENLYANALHENWQVRENAIEAIGKSGRRESVGALKKVIEQRPESATAVLKAVAQLGFSKGLEIAFTCLRMPEALVEREALATIGKLTSQRHAKAVRAQLMKLVPSLQATVRDTAGEVVTRLTEEFGLEPLDVDQETYFDTRLIKIDETGAIGQQPTDPVEVASAPQVQNIEDFKKGDVWLERYCIDREIGRGAMGRVMLAEDQMVGEQLILKFMHPELTAEQSSRERFLREVRYSRKVSHPNVIRVHDMLFHEGLSAISMEFFESRGVDEVLKEKKFFEEQEALDILLQVALGMGAAHDQDVIHRDLKPSNILMNDKGLVKVVDFGIASATAQSEATLTQAGSIIGTPAYISPERARGLEADHRADIYAVGVIAYCMFSGKLPYIGEPMSLLFQHIEGKAPPVHEVREGVSPRVSMLVRKMMAVDLDDRLQTMSAVAEAIRDVQAKMA